MPTACTPPATPTAAAAGATATPATPEVCPMTLEEWATLTEVWVQTCSVMSWQSSMVVVSTMVVTSSWHSCTGLLLHCCSVLVSVWVMVLVWQTGSETVWPLLRGDGVIGGLAVRGGGNPLGNSNRSSSNTNGA